MFYCITCTSFVYLRMIRINNNNNNKGEKMTKVNIDKFKKHLKLVTDSTPSGEPAIFDGYGIHESLVSWALRNISTKELIKMTKEKR